MKKKGFQFGIGLTKISADLDVSGSSVVVANVGGVIEVEGDVEASITGSLQLSAGSKGQLVPLNDWLSTMKNIKKRENVGFGSAQVTVDGFFDASVKATAPFALDVGKFEGSFKQPFILDLFNNTNGTGSRPDIVFDINLPNMGDLSNLTFEQVVGLLKQALDFLVGSKEGDTVDSCTGGLMGKEVFGEPVFLYKIPIMGVSACETASFLKVVVDAVNSLVNGCPKSDGGNSADATSTNTTSTDSTECSGTFQKLEVMLESLLQG